MRVSKVMGYLLCGMILAAGILFFVENNALAEDVTITTYYPAPYGVYKNLTTTEDTYLATDFGYSVGIGTSNPSEELHVVGDIYCTGKLTSDGGNDPPYVAYGMETRKSIIERVEKEIPKEKLNQAVLFWNEEADKFEVYLPAKGQLMDLQGQILTMP